MSCNTTDIKNRDLERLKEMVEVSSMCQYKHNSHVSHDIKYIAHLEVNKKYKPGNHCSTCRFLKMQLKFKKVLRWKMPENFNPLAWLSSTWITSVLTWLGAFSNQHLGLASPFSSVLGVARTGHRRHKLAR